MAGTPPVPGEAASPDDVVADLRIANARLRELLAERDTQVTALAGQLEEQLVLIGELTAQVAK